MDGAWLEDRDQNSSMSTLDSAAAEFLALERIAVVGVSRSGDQPANLIYRKLKTSTRHVVPINPNAARIEDDVCFANIASIPGGVDGAVIATTPEVACSVIDECAEAGVKQVWIHRSFGQGSVSPAVIDRCRETGLKAIPGACPMMYCEPVDPGHKCIRFLARIAGKLPKPLPAHQRE